MPAASLTRLKEQLHALDRAFSQPAEYVRGLNAVLELYSERNYRPGNSLQPVRLIPAYRAPVFVLRQVELELSQLAAQNPDSALAVADLLWQDVHLECRQLAATLLGQTPLKEPQEVLSRLDQWLTMRGEEKALSQYLLEKGSLRLRREQPTLWINHAAEWLQSSKLFLQSAGLKALIPLAEDPSFENLPALFAAIQPVVQNAPVSIQAELLAVLEPLARRASTETASFMRLQLSIATRPEVSKLVRRLLPFFTPAAQANLRTLLPNR